VPRVKDNNPDKQRTLRQHGTFNPRPQDVTHPLFQDSEFFDAHDLVQVKYEMLRQVRVDKRPVSQTAKEFGFSRPSFYQAEFTFEQSGLSGLLPGKRGPRSGHKLTPEVMKFVAEQRTADPSLSFAQLAEAVKQKFNLRVHPRSIERQLLREKKRQ
jgi:transposase